MTREKWPHSLLPSNEESDDVINLLPTSLPSRESGNKLAPPWTNLHLFFSPYTSPPQTIGAFLDENTSEEEWCSSHEYAPSPVSPPNFPTQDPWEDAWAPRSSYQPAAPMPQCAASPRSAHVRLSSAPASSSISTKSGSPSLPPASIPTSPSPAFPAPSTLPPPLHHCSAPSGPLPSHLNAPANQAPPRLSHVVSPQSGPIAFFFYLSEVICEYRVCGKLLKRWMLATLSEILSIFPSIKVSVLLLLYLLGRNHYTISSNLERVFSGGWWVCSPCFWRFQSPFCIIPLHSCFIYNASHIQTTKPRGSIQWGRDAAPQEWVPVLDRWWSTPPEYAKNWGSDQERRRCIRW